MEDLRSIQLNNGFNLEESSMRRKSSRKIKTRSKTRTTVLNFNKFKRNIIAFNVIMSIVLIVLIAASYSEMVTISSDNLIMEQKIADLEINLNSIENIAMQTNSDNRIKKIASSRLDMVIPTSENMVAIEKNSSEKIVDLDKQNIQTASTSESNSVISIITDILR